MSDPQIIKGLAILLILILSIGFVLMAWSDQKTKEFMRDLERKRLDDCVNNSLEFFELFNTDVLSFPIDKKQDEKISEVLKGDK